jgi:hypothetical protein
VLDNQISDSKKARELFPSVDLLAWQSREKNIANE